MIQINREQAMEIRKKLRNIHVTVCNRQSPSRKKSYYVEDSYSVVRLLQDMEKDKKIEHYE